MPVSRRQDGVLGHARAHKGATPPDVYEPWLQLPGETAKAHAAFVVFREQDPTARSVDAAWRQAKGRQTGRAPRLWRAWAASWDWDNRALAYDREQDRLYIARRARQRRQLRDRKVSYGRLLVGRTVPRLNEIEPQALDLAMALKLLELGLRLESEGLGDTMDTPEGVGVAAQEESYVDRIHRLQGERGLTLLNGGERSEASS
jgi:hypothetical protein